MAKKRNNNPYGQRGFGYRGNRRIKSGLTCPSGCLMLMGLPVLVVVVISALT